MGRQLQQHERQPERRRRDERAELATLDIYSARVIVTPDPLDTPSDTPVGPGSPLAPKFLGKDTVSKGKSYKFQVKYTSPAGIDVSTLGDDDILVTGPNGYSLFADFTKAKASKGGSVTATYIAQSPGGLFDQGDNGLYSMIVQGGSVKDLAGTTTTAGLLDQFLVSSRLAPSRPRCTRRSRSGRRTSRKSCPQSGCDNPVRIAVVIRPLAHRPPCMTFLARQSFCALDSRRGFRSMNLVSSALRRPITVLVLVISAALMGVMAVSADAARRLPRPRRADASTSPSRTAAWTRRRWKGSSPTTTSTTSSTSTASSTSRVEERSRASSLMKLQFHPGTDMAQAMAETVAYVNRVARVHAAGHRRRRSSCGSTPAACRSATSSSPATTRTSQLKDLQDAALFKVRPMFATLPGVSAPPPFGGSPRTIVVSVDPDRLRAYDMCPDEVVAALAQGQHDQPVGQHAHRRHRCRSCR